MQIVSPLKIPKALWLAPLAGYSNAPFRYISKKCGADILVTEMISADGVKKNFDRMQHYTKYTELERPIGFQLFGDNPDIMANAALLLTKFNPDFFDINMGCPVKKVVKRYAGAALMLKPLLAENIVQKVASVLKEKNIPLTVKIRAGWDSENLNALDFAQMLENAGANAIIVHPRTRNQLFQGKSDWEIIKAIKNKLHIPIIGNGDITSPQDAMAMLQNTNCDAIMIGRAALGNPWIFYEVKNFLIQNKLIYSSEKNSFVYNNDEKLKIIFEHIDKVIEHNNNTNSLIPMRAHFAFYTKGFNFATEARKIIFSSQNPNEIKNTLANLYHHNNNG